MPPVASPSIWGGNVAWVVVFVANLIVPVMLGWEVTGNGTGNGGRVGMIAATAVALLLTLLLVPKWSELRKTLVAGGVFTAIIQAFPFVQFVAGILSLGTVALLGLMLESGGLTEPGGFLATLLTAFLMMAAAFPCGVVIRAAGRDAARQRRQREALAAKNPTPAQRAVILDARGQLLLALGDIDTAVDVFREATELDPQYSSDLEMALKQQQAQRDRTAPPPRAVARP